MTSGVSETNQVLPKAIPDSKEETKNFLRVSSSDLDGKTNSNDKVTASVEKYDCSQIDIRADRSNVETTEDQIADSNDDIEDAVAIEALGVETVSNNLEVSSEETEPYNEQEKIPQMDANGDLKEAMSQPTSTENYTIPSKKISSDSEDFFEQDLTLKKPVNEHMTLPILNASLEQESDSLLKINTENVKDSNNNAFVLTSDELKPGENAHQISVEASESKKELAVDTLNNGCEQDSDEGSTINGMLPEAKTKTENKSTEFCSNSAPAFGEKSKPLVKESVPYAVSKIHNEANDFFCDETPTNVVKENCPAQPFNKSSIEFKTIENECDNHDSYPQEESDDDFPKRGSIQRHSRRSPVVIRSTRSSFLSDSGSDSSLKRRSCMPRESVATLTEFFEAKTVELSPLPSRKHS